MEWEVVPRPSSLGTVFTLIGGPIRAQAPGLCFCEKERVYANEPSLVSQRRLSLGAERSRLSGGEFGGGAQW